MPASRRSLLSENAWGKDRFQGTVLNDIAFEIFLFTGWATLITCINQLKQDLSISSSMLTVLGTVLGLVVSFRTTSAYDRFWEGRKLWSSVTVASRNLSQLIWIHIPIDRKSTPEKPLPVDAKLRHILEKKSMVNLVQAFSVSVKHFLRGEPGIFYEDLYPLVSFLPKNVDVQPATFSDPIIHEHDQLPVWHTEASTLARMQTMNIKQQGSQTTVVGDANGVNAKKQRGSAEGATTPGASTIDLEKARDSSAASAGPRLPPGVTMLPARSPPKESIYDYVPLLLPFKPFASLIANVLRPDREKSGRNWYGRKIRPEISLEGNIPLEIILFLQSYFQFVMANDLLKPATATGYMNAIAMFQDTVASLERIRTTPIPFAYQAHLRMTVWLYLLFLPFQVVAPLGWVTIPGTAFAAFLYLGFLEIGAEIEDPFDYDANDLDLDRFCDQIARELSEITAHPVANPADYIFGDFNQPLAPADMRSAAHILSDDNHDYHDPQMGVLEVRRALLKSWRKTSGIKVKSKKKKTVGSRANSLMNVFDTNREAH